MKKNPRKMKKKASNIVQMNKIYDVFRRYKPLLSQSEFQSFLDTCNEDLQKSIRVNTIKISVSDFRKHNEKYLKWKFTAIPWCKKGFFVNRDNKEEAIGNSIEHQTGLFYVQEASSMLPAIILSPKKTDIVLDMSAAPGSKTTHMAALMHNTGAILANDISSKRIKGLESNLKRMGIINTAVIRKNGLFFGKRFPNTFDKILLDAPCTGEGLVRKERSIVQKWSLKNIHIMSKLQKGLIQSAFLALKKGGSLVYSTCTLSPEENEEVIDFLIEKYGDILEIEDLSQDFSCLANKKQIKGILKWEKRTFHSDVQKSLRIWPHTFNTEGFFICKINKLYKTPIKKRELYNIHLNENYKKLGKKEIKSIMTFFRKSYNYEPEIERNYCFLKSKRNIILISKQLEQFRQTLKILFSGLIIGYLKDPEIKISHEAVILWGSHFSKRVHHLTKEKKEDYMKGKNINLQKHDYQDGTIVLMYNNIALGKGLLRGNVIKNQLAREYVIRGN